MHTLPLVIAPIVVGSIFKLFTVQGLGPLPHILKDYFGYKSVITVTTDADEGDAVFSPRSYGPEDQNLVDDPDENFEEDFYDSGEGGQGL